MGRACSFGCALAHFHSCLPSFAPVCHSCPVGRLCLFVVCVCSSFTPVPTYWPHTLLVIQSMGCVRSFRCAFVQAHALFCSCPLSFTPATALCDMTYVMNIRFQTVTNILMNMSSGHITWKHILRRNTLVWSYLILSRLLTLLLQRR